MCLDFPYSVCLKRFSFQKELIEIWSNMYIGLHVKYLLSLSDFNESWILSTAFQKTEISNWIKIRPVAAQLFHAHRGRTYMTKLTLAFRNFADAPKIEKYLLCHLIKCHRSIGYMQNFTPQLPYLRSLSFDYQPGVSPLVITLNISWPITNS